jgi:hypothetical protein
VCGRGISRERRCGEHHELLEAAVRQLERRNHDGLPLEHGAVGALEHSGTFLLKRPDESRH